MNVQCPQCGQVQVWEKDYPTCTRCGHSLSEMDVLILKNPRKGRGMMGIAILLFIAFALLFIFTSKFFGAWGMVISLLFYIWGNYKSRLNKEIGYINDDHPYQS